MLDPLQGKLQCQWLTVAKSAVLIGRKVQDVLNSSPEYHSHLSGVSFIDSLIHIGLLSGSLTGIDISHLVMGQLP